MQLLMRGEDYFYSQSQKFNSTQNNFKKLVITINGSKETLNAHKELSHQLIAT